MFRGCGYDGALRSRPSCQHRSESARPFSFRVSSLLGSDEVGVCDSSVLGRRWRLEDDMRCDGRRGLSMVKDGAQCAVQCSLI